ncbi:MAG: VOC family protein [Acidobacteriota bacterium]|nr:VOC family protein [Acidobacteriota bacterium]
MPTTTTALSEISLVCVPATDQDRSIEFYEQKLGFEKRTDIPFGDRYRWVEVYPSAGATGIALAPPREGDPVGVQTGIVLPTDDIDATHRALAAAGVDVDAAVMRVGDPVPPMFWLRDPDGNSLLIVERAERG